MLSPGPTPRHRARGPAGFGRRGLPGANRRRGGAPGARRPGARRAGSRRGPRCRGAGPGRRPADFRHKWL